MLNNKSIPGDVKSYYEFCAFFLACPINKGSNMYNM